MASTRISRADYEALADVRYRIRRFLNFSEAAARAAGLEPQQHQLLLARKALRDGERPTISVLAEKLSVRHHSAVELVTRSAEQGLCVRRPSELDRREVLVEITPKGERLLKALSVAHRDELRSAAPVLLRALSALVGAPPEKRSKRGDPR